MGFPPAGGSGTGTVTSVSSADANLTVATPTTTPVLTVVGAPPNGTAGGDLTGTFPNPTVAAGKITTAKLASAVTLDAIATANATAGNIAMATHKLTGLSAGSGAGDSLRYEQVIGANVLAVSNLAAGTAGQVLGGTGPSYSLPPGYEFDYVQITAPVNVTATSEATATTIITGNAVTYDGSTTVLVQVFSPEVLLDTASAGDQLQVVLYDGSSSIGKMAIFRTPSITSQEGVPLYAQYRFTPTAAAHTYSIRAFVAATTGTPSIQAGAGGVGAFMPAFYRITKV